jgi:hypothetical protein
VANLKWHENTLKIFEKNRTIALKAIVTATSWPQIPQARSHKAQFERYFIS